MKEYMKPTIAIAAATGSNPITCIQKVDTELIFEITGIPIKNIKDAFAVKEACLEPVPIDFYCKYTSADMGGIQAFIS